VTAGDPAQTYTYAATIAAVPLGRVSEWQSGASLLQQLWAASTAGRAGSAVSQPARHPQSTGPAGVTAAAPAPAASLAASPAPYFGQEQQLAVLCSDSPNPRNPRAYPGLAAFAYARSGGFGPDETWDSERCARWPAAAAQDRYSGPWNRPTAGTILLVGNTGDPVTPYQDSVAMSHELARARLLTVEGYGHTEASNPSTCATEDEIRYVLTGALPPAGTVCPQDGTPFSPTSGS
jgi:hypothetical protein